MKNSIRVLGLILAMLLCTNSSYAQFSTYGPDQRYQSYIYENETLSIPPLRTDMSKDCMVGYIAMDSISKMVPIEEVLNSPLSTSLDSMRVAARFMYAVTEYSPKLLRNYMFVTRDILQTGHYLSFPANSYYGLNHAIQSRINEFGKDYAMLCLAHYILRVRVDQVISGVDTTYPGEPIPWTNVSCTVIQRIKGIYLPNNCKYEAKREKSDKIQVVGDNCLNFGYPTFWNTNTGFDSQRGKNTSTTMRMVNPGEEYYVFLVQMAYNDNADVLVPVNQLETSGGLFKISNGMVEDESDFWGLGKNPMDADFYTYIMNLIKNLKLWWVK